MEKRAYRDVAGMDNRWTTTGMGEDEMIGKFVTAKLKGKTDCRQGWVVSEDPFIVQVQSGAFYEIDGDPSDTVEVISPPERPPTDIRDDGKISLINQRGRELWSCDVPDSSNYVNLPCPEGEDG